MFCIFYLKIQEKSYDRLRSLHSHLFFRCAPIKNASTALFFQGHGGCGFSPNSLSLLQNLPDAAAGLAVAVGVLGFGHDFIGVGVGQQLPAGGVDAVKVGADQPQCSCLDALGPFGGVPHDEHRLSQGRGFLLDAAAVR